LYKEASGKNADERAGGAPGKGEKGNAQGLTENARCCEKVLQKTPSRGFSNSTLLDGNRVSGIHA